MGSRVASVALLPAERRSRIERARTTDAPRGDICRRRLLGRVAGVSWLGIICTKKVTDRPAGAKIIRRVLAEFVLFLAGFA